MDGGTVWNLNIEDAIRKCLEIVPDEEHVVLDVAITEFVNLETLNSTGHSYNNFMRSRQLHNYYKVMNDVD